MALKQIKKILDQSHFDQLKALSAHRCVLKKEGARIEKLIKTIDKTINHLKGVKTMKENEMYWGFNEEKQKEYEKYLIDHFGDRMKKTIDESHQKIKNWTKDDWKNSQEEFDLICKAFVQMIDNNCEPKSQQVQDIVQKHYEWLKRFWTPTKESYFSHADLIVKSDLKKPYLAYHLQLPEFVAKAIKIFAENVL